MAVPTRRPDRLLQRLYHPLVPRGLKSDFGEIERARYRYVISGSVDPDEGSGVVTGL